MAVLLFSEPCMHGCASRCLGNPRSPSTPYKRIPWGRAKPRYICYCYCSSSCVCVSVEIDWTESMVSGGDPEQAALQGAGQAGGSDVAHQAAAPGRQGGQARGLVRRRLSSAVAPIYICICFSGQTYSMNNGDIYDGDGAGGTGSLSRTGTRWACRWWADSQRPAAGAPCCSPTHSWASAKTQPSLLLLLRHIEFVRLVVWSIQRIIYVCISICLSIFALLLSRITPGHYFLLLCAQSLEPSLETHVTPDLSKSLSKAHVISPYLESRLRKEHIIDYMH